MRANRRSNVARTTAVWGLALAMATAACGPDAVGGADVVVVRNGTLVDGTGRAPVPDAVVVIEAGVVTAVGSAAEVVAPDAGQVVDAGGGTILPGLVDTHVHHLNDLDVEDGEVVGPGIARALTAPLESGVTTYRDVGSPFGDAAEVADLREALAARGAHSPTVVLSGPLLAAEGNFAVVGFPGQAVAVPDGAAAAGVVTDLLDAGVDQIKLMVEHWEFRVEPSPSLSAEQIEVMAAAAHARDVRVVAHVSDVDEAWMALDGGVDELTHWPGPDPLPDELVDELVARDVAVGTTFSILRPAPGDVRRLLDAGGTIVLSSDAPGAMSTRTIWRELERMVTEGMTPMEAIVASTSAAARVLELDERLGTLTEGREGDVLVVDGDPLADIAALADVTAVLNDGVVVG